MAEDSYILSEVVDRVALFTLNRPELMNAMGPDMHDTLNGLIRDAGADPGVGVIMLTGAGRAFCAGRDMKAAARTQGEAPRGPAPRRSGLANYMELIRRIPKPVIAAVNGPAVGGGMSLALACDMRIASERAMFSQAFIKRGVIPAGGAIYVLPRLIGTAKACELMLSGDPIGAKEAKRLGIVNRVVPHEELMDAAMAWARQLAAGAPVALGLAKASIYRTMELDLKTSLEAESFAQDVCGDTEDHAEGVAAFVEKRPPRFKGQ